MNPVWIITAVHTELRFGAVGLSVGVNMAVLYTVYDESVNDRIEEVAKAPTPSPITNTTSTTKQTTSTIVTNTTISTNTTIPTNTTTTTTTTTTMSTLPTEPTPFVMSVDGLGEITGYLDAEFNDVVAFRVSEAFKSYLVCRLGSPIWLTASYAYVVYLNHIGHWGWFSGKESAHLTALRDFELLTPQNFESKRIYQKFINHI